MTFFVNTRSTQLMTKKNRAKLTSCKAKSTFIKVFWLKAQDTYAEHKHKHIKKHEQGWKCYTSTCFSPLIGNDSRCNFPIHLQWGV